MPTAEEAIERIARESYGRLLAFLVSRSRDIAGAEDALASALGAALVNWRSAGVPANPGAWLLTAARRKLVDGARHARVATLATHHLLLAYDEAESALSSERHYPDERLKLLFACAHPAIDPAARSPLMMQVVLGIETGQIASVYLVGAAAMTKRLTRAKARIREAGVPFHVPDAHELAPRLDDVLTAIYVAFTLGHDRAADGSDARSSLASEAIWLARIIASLLPAEPEARGLLALLLFCEARRSAGRAADGSFVPLAEQDTALWDETMLVEAERLLRSAGRPAMLGCFQLEAAIQAVHVDRQRHGTTDWAAIVHLYDGLVATTPALGAAIGRAAAICASGDPARGLSLLDALPTVVVGAHQPYWATRAHICERLDLRQDAATTYRRAAGLTADPAIRTFLLARAQRNRCTTSANQV